jgi:nucleotide-binding universal stress UspA family protein
MKKVLIALDYNPSAKKVAEEGYALANAMNAQAVLLHVISDISYYSSIDYSPIMGFGGFTSLDMLQTNATSELKNVADAYLEKSKQHLGDDTIQIVTRNGDYGQTIIDTATELKADIIVMGTHSRRGLEKILIGSVAEKVLHNTTIPVFIIPTRSIEQK